MVGLALICAIIKHPEPSAHIAGHKNPPVAIAPETEGDNGSNGATTARGSQGRNREKPQSAYSAAEST